MRGTPSTHLGIDGRKIVLCVGPGGVGKTTCAAAIALAAAKAGRRVIVLTIDPSRRLAQALGLELTATGDAATGKVVPVEGLTGGSLDALILHTRSVFDDIVRAYAKSPEAAANIVDNPLYQATVQRLGGALEYAAMARLQMLHAEAQYDLIVLDTPPTANAIDFLEAPQRVKEVVSNPVARVLAGTGRVGMKILGLGASVIMNALHAIGGGEFITDFGRFLRDFSDVLAEFHRRGGDFDTMLRSPDTGVVLATAASEFTVREADGFLGVLQERGLHIDGVVLNRVEPEIPPWPVHEDAAEALLGRRFGDRAQTVLGQARRVSEGLRTAAKRAASARASLERSNANTPIVVIPREDPPPTTLDELGAVGRRLLGHEA